MARAPWQKLVRISAAASASLCGLASSRPKWSRCDAGLRAAAPAAQHAEILEKARLLRSTYRPAYAFPRWVCDNYLGERFEDYACDAGASAIFFDEGDQRGAVLQLAREREPVNVGMRRGYDQALFSSSFGWQTGAYGALSLSGLPPNIAVMCPTPVLAGLAGPEQQLSPMQLEELNDGCRRLHILSVIAYAFDSKEQPDQAYFLGEEGQLSAEKRRELAERLGKVFDKVFAAALHYNRKVIVISKFGAGAFSENYPGELFEEIWLPAFEEALRAWAPKLKEGQVREVSLMGGDFSEDFAKAVVQAGFRCELYSYFPEPLRKQLGAKLQEAVVVNAWDSWSLIGNGNFADRSLDGFVGRATALAVLGWPVTNPWLQENMIAVKRPEPGS